MRNILLILIATAISALAQQDDAKSKGGRMIFQPGSNEPIIANPPAPTPRTVSQPTEVMNQFFQALKSGNVDAAYEGLVRGTIIADRAEDVTALKTRTKTALDNYGPVTGFEVVDEKQVGTSLMRQTCVSLNTDLPLRWRFYFYKSGGNWKRVDLRVDDALVELFEEAGRSGK